MRVESLWWPRLRWRLRGAFQWPAFAVLTALDAAILVVLPFYGDGPDGLGAVLLAGFYNLALVALVAPLAGFALRRVRRDLPRLVANDYAGTFLLAAGTAVLLAAGVAHRPAVAAEADDERAVVAGVHDWVLARAPAYRSRLGQVDALRLEADLYRACLPGGDPRRWLCLYVNTRRRPAGVTLDHERVPNAAFRVFGR